MTKDQEKELDKKIKDTLRDVQFQGLKSGAKGILGAVLDMCNNGKTVEDIKNFCEKSLAMKGMEDQDLIKDKNLTEDKHLAEER